MGRWLHGLLVVAMASGATAHDAQDAQDPQQKDRFVEKVEVRARTVLVFITDARGKVPTAPLAPTDLRVLEDGKPVEVLAIEPVRRSAGAVAADAGAGADRPEAPAAPPAQPVPQYLYLDTTSVRQRTVPRIAEAVESSLGAILANGPLEIVVADPEPAVMMRSTSDRETVRAALARLPSAAVGKDHLYDARRDAMARMNSQYDSTNRSVSGTFRGDLRAAIRHEMALISNVTSRLDRWAATLPYDRASVVYLCSDGFDHDLTEVYREMLMSTQYEVDTQIAMQLQSEFTREAAQVTSRAGEVLAGRGATAIVLALGTSDADFATSAGNLGKRPDAAKSRALDAAPVFHFKRPNEPLLVVADRTGGQVVSTPDKLPQAVDTIGGAFLVTFRSQAPADSASHPLQIASAAGNLRVRAPQAVLAAPSQAASAGAAVRALSAPSTAAPSGALPVEVSILDIQPAERGRRRGTLEVSADLASIVEALELLGPGRVRVTVAVEHAKGAPFTHSEETDLDDSGGGTRWAYEAPITWPPEATRIAVTIEELKTGARGSGVADLPKSAE